ncbi:hypothetical protein Mag101_02150 [Microbulbifer agarilyticus]|uniref:Uncharacterized protein n=1 Tax=Microbulbifer agarilyticus TaxID=260552 RepID=A0A1Q2M1K1_9GAMM|nr:hypothetical protein Mag101_02150 [Microbulbifer agarilyticus]
MWVKFKARPKTKPAHQMGAHNAPVSAFRTRTSRSSKIKLRKLQEFSSECFFTLVRWLQSK